MDSSHVPSPPVDHTVHKPPVDTHSHTSHQHTTHAAAATSHNEAAPHQELGNQLSDAAVPLTAPPAAALTPSDPEQVNVSEPDLEGDLIVRWILIIMLICFVLGGIFMVINAHFSPY